MELLIACGVLALLVLLKVYLVARAGVCRSPERMDGKTVIVTGANSGIGYETALELGRRGARVVLACRSAERGAEAARRIAQRTGNPHVTAHLLDLASQTSVRRFAAEMHRTLDRLDVLVHNAALMPRPGRHLTEDGLELQFATNHLGPFLLNALLLDLLLRSAPARVVVVSSVTHRWATLDPDDLCGERRTRDPYWVYCSTKLANLLFARELSRRLRGTGVTSNALHPGAVRTRTARHARWFVKWLLVPVLWPFLKSGRSGAQTSVYLCVSEEVREVSGEYFVDCRPARPSAAADDPHLARRLWEASERLTLLESGS